MNINVILEIATYFIIYSFLGWVLESIYKTIVQKEFVNSGFLHGPFCAIYGFGALIMILMFNSLKTNYIILFLIAFVVLTIWEYIVGCILEKIFNTKYWDYSENKFNFQGRICLKSSLTWGIVAIVFINFIHPIFENAIENISNNILIVTNILIYIYLTIDLVITIIKLKHIYINLDALNEIAEKLKQKVNEEIIEELKSKQLELKESFEKRSKRFRKAFPTMKYKKIKVFLTQKLEKIKK